MKQKPAFSKKMGTQRRADTCSGDCVDVAFEKFTQI